MHTQILREHEDGGDKIDLVRGTQSMVEDPAGSRDPLTRTVEGDVNPPSPLTFESYFRGRLSLTSPRSPPLRGNRSQVTLRRLIGLP